MQEQVYTVTDFQVVCNQILETAFSGVVVEGEVASFKVNQGKFVFFDLKDDGASVGCFMMKFALRFPIEDGMKLRVRAVPKLTAWGKFSLTVQSVIPVGEGSLKKSFELLKRKLLDEGLFDAAKKRPLPINLERIGVISSTQAAGYADFCKILNERWGGLRVEVAHTQVQGMVAADQIIRALRYFNERGGVDVIAIIRGGGSADDLAVFNDEALVRAIAASKIPVITGIGHEVDESLSDLAADVVASTPSNAAQLLTRDRRVEKVKIEQDLRRINNLFNSKIDDARLEVKWTVGELRRALEIKLERLSEDLRMREQILAQLNPENVLKRGYVIVRGKLQKGELMELITYDREAVVEVKSVGQRVRFD